MKTASPAFHQGLLALALILACRASTAQAPLGTNSNIRAPAVAGLFYPKESRELAASIDGFLAAVPTNPQPQVRALICPHAGYEYSGPVAARAYRWVAGRSIDTVIILAASHYALFQGVSVAATEAYER